MLKWHKFDIKSKDSKLLVIDKTHSNNEILFKGAIDYDVDSRQ